MMRKPTKDPIREDRIHNEAIVEAYGSEEQAMSWYYYLENKIRFPFSAKCIVANLVSPLKKRRDRRSPPPGAGGRLFHGYARAHSLAGPEHGGASIPTGSARSGRIHRRSHR
jgi:hypothetical protein